MRFIQYSGDKKRGNKKKSSTTKKIWWLCGVSCEAKAIEKPCLVVTTKIMASVGHIRDLKINHVGDFDNNYERNISIFARKRSLDQWFKAKTK